MPVIRIETTTNITTLPPEKRASLLCRLQDEVDRKTISEKGPVIFEIPLGSDFHDILVVWEEWDRVASEERTDLILEAYGGRQSRISQALGVTYKEAMEQQLLPYVVVSAFEQNPKFASLACKGDPQEIKKLLDKIRDAKLKNGGIEMPDGKIELRFPNRAMADNIHLKLLSDEEYSALYWSISVEVSASNSL